jgi:DNA-binding CsgD family transcriptional regulator
LTGRAIGCPIPRVVRCNPAAQALLARGDGLRLDDGRVRCVRAGADQALQRALADASRDEAPTARVLVVPRASGRRPLLVFASGVRDVGGGERRPVAVLVRDVDGPGPHAEEVLKGLFGLTPAETRLTLAIAEGQSLAEAAEAFGCARETMRTHLSRVFDKTATTRQAELVRLVLGELPPVLSVRARQGR